MECKPIVALLVRFFVAEAGKRLIQIRVYKTMVLHPFQIVDRFSKFRYIEINSVHLYSKNYISRFAKTTYNLI